MFTYRVKVTFLFQGNHAQLVGDYESLFDAISVVKNTKLHENVVSRSALSDEAFNEKFFELLTNGYTYTGNKSSDYPDGNIVVHLVKVDPVYNEEMAVYGDKTMYNVLPAIPQQQSKFLVHYRDENDKRKTADFKTRSEAMAFIKAKERDLISTNFPYVP